MAKRLGIAVAVTASVVLGATSAQGEPDVLQGSFILFECFDARPVFIPGPKFRQHETTKEIWEAVFAGAELTAPTMPPPPEIVFAIPGSRYKQIPLEKP